MGLDDRDRNGDRHPGQKVKGQLVADVLNNQHTGTGATWRIRRYCQLAGVGGISWRPPAYSLLNLLFDCMTDVIITTAQHCGALANSAAVYNTKNNGPRTEPWGINAPQQMDEQRTLTIVQTDRQTDRRTDRRAEMLQISRSVRAIITRTKRVATRNIRPTSETQ